MPDDTMGQLANQLPSAHKPHWIELIYNPGGVSALAQELALAFPAQQVATDGTQERRIWELIGVHYRERGQWHSAIVIYTAMYEHFIALQQATGLRVHKGMPLVWIADCYASLNNITLSKRFLRLTLIEDAISFSGLVDPLETGSYFRLSSRHGMSDADIRRYALESHAIATKYPAECLFPEFVLQELDKAWLIEKPSPNDSSIYVANTKYIASLVDNLGEPSGKTLERLADYLLASIPGCRTARRQRTPSTDYDIVGSLEGPDVDFRSEFGRYFVCECKDWKTPADFTAFAKFARVVASVKAKLGIIFSREGITGEGEAKDADREQLKVFQSEGIIIIVVDQADLRLLCAGASFVTMLRQKYEEVRLDLRSLAPQQGGA